MTLPNPFQTNQSLVAPIGLSAPRYLAVQALRQHGKLSRTSIAEMIGYSPSKITSVVNALMEAGIVEEKDDSAYTGGRRARDLYFNPNFGYIIAVAIQTDKLDVSLVDFSEQVRVRRMFPIAINSEPSKVMGAATDFILKRLTKLNIPIEKVYGIGITLPGAVNPQSGTLFDSPDLPGWGGYQISSFIRETFPYAVIVIDKDANAMAFAELRKGRGQNRKNLIYVNVSNSIRAGLILDNHIYHGENGRAGDIGDVILPAGQDFTSLDTLAKAMSITTTSQSEGTSLATEALEGNLEAKRVIEQSGKHIGQVLATLVSILDPELILIGGWASNLGHPFLAAIRRSILAYSQSFSTEHLQVELAPLGDDSSLTGIVALTAESIFLPEKL